MENLTLAAGGDHTEGRGIGLRMGSMLAAMALVFAMVVLVQQRAEASPATGGAVAASVAAVGAGDTVSAQININQIVCSILLSIRSSFAGSPFFSFIAPIIDNLLAAFDCVPSPG